MRSRYTELRVIYDYFLQGHICFISGELSALFLFFFCAASFSRCTEADKGLAFCKYAPEIVRVALVCAARAHVDVTCKS